MSILNNIWNRIARKPDRRKAAATEFSETGNRVYAVATEEGVMLFSDTPKGMKARNSYLQHLADGFFNVAKVPETLRIYEMDLPTKRVAELADNCIEKLSKADLRSTDAQLRRSVVSFAPDKFADRSVLDSGVCREKFDLRPDFHNFDRLTREFGLGISPRKNMARILEICRSYAETFSQDSGSLLLTGDPGLGKTFLSAAIARVVSGDGWSVVYDTAGRIFQRFEAQKFGREEGDGASADVERVLGCDLLILDDLGTEMTTAFVQSALYQIVNTRLLEKRPTILSTNLRVEALHSRYSPQIASRIEGEYQILPFFGEDIRRLKRERG